MLRFNSVSVADLVRGLGPVRLAYQYVPTAEVWTISSFLYRESITAIGISVLLTLPGLLTSYAVLIS